jgi:hypothetical protein
MLSSEEPLLFSTNSRRLFFKISSSETKTQQFLAFLTAQMFRLPTFLLLRRSSDLSGELEIKSWSEIFLTHKFPRNESEIKPTSFRAGASWSRFLESKE